MIIQGDCVSMCPSNQISDQEYEELLQKYEYSFQKGDLVKGSVCAYDSEGAIVDIGAKTNAICPEKEAISTSCKFILIFPKAWVKSL